MNHLQAFKFLQERLVPITTRTETHTTSGDEDDEQIGIDPIDCPTFKQLTDHLFADGKNGLQYSAEIEQTVATMAAVVLSTTATGGQLGLRVIGPPGGAKSTLSECFSCCPQLIYSRSKFTGIVSGWSSIRKSQLMAHKINGKCVLIKDADMLTQQSNIRQIESEIRDVLGDGVIRAEYRTGRQFTIHTLFSMILCGTDALRQLDNALLGARFLDISIHKRGSDTSNIVRRAIRSQFSTITSQLSGEVTYEESNGKASSPRRKEMILKLAPPMVGFLLHKHQQIKSGIVVAPFSERQEDLIQAMGDLIAVMRLKVKRDVSRDITYRPEKEISTRLGEQITRMLIYLGIVLQDTTRGRVEVGESEFAIAKKILVDTAEGFPFDIVKYLASILPERSGGNDTQISIANETGIQSTSVAKILQDLRATGVVIANRVGNCSSYALTPNIYELCKKVGVGSN